jgi:hypothetical protein
MFELFKTSLLEWVEITWSFYFRQMLEISWSLYFRQMLEITWSLYNQFLDK